MYAMMGRSPVVPSIPRRSTLCITMFFSIQRCEQTQVNTPEEAEDAADDDSTVDGDKDEVEQGHQGP